MSYYNATKNPFPFYPLEGEVWTNKKPLWFQNNCYFNFQKYPVFPGKRYFQLKVSNNIQNQTDRIDINLRRVSDNVIVPATISKTLFALANFNKKLVTMAIDIPTDYVDGKFYISVATDFGSFYSEPFCIQNPDDSVGIIWSSSKGLVGDLVYPADFRHYVNLEAEIIPSEPTIEEETLENGFGEEEATLQILKQGFRFSFEAPNFLAQALSALRLHDQIQILNRKAFDYDEDLNDSVKDIQVKLTPEEDGCFSFVEITYVEETIIKTGCIDDIQPLNNPPIADIVWNDTRTTEDRVCNSDNTCNTAILATDDTYDPDGNLDYIEWEKSADDGMTWESLGNGTTGQAFNISEDDEGLFWYRLKAVDTYNAIGYSNILKFNVDNSPAFDNVRYTVVDSNFLYTAKEFNIIGQPSQNVKLRLKVLNTYGRGFTLTFFDTLTNAQLFTWSNVPAGTILEKILTLDGAGVGRYAANLSLQPCNGEAYQKTEIEFILYKNDNVNLGSSSTTIEKYFSCGTVGVPVTLPPGWLP